MADGDSMTGTSVPLLKKSKIICTTSKKVKNNWEKLFVHWIIGYLDSLP